VSKKEPELKEGVMKEIEDTRTMSGTNSVGARKEIKERKGKSTEKIAKEFGIKL